jgi:lipopolysaccharide biosynthesis regulator YciM
MTYTTTTLDERLRDRGRKKGHKALAAAMQVLEKFLTSEESHTKTEALKGAVMKNSNSYYGAIKEGENPTVRALIEEIVEVVTPAVLQRFAQAEVDEFLQNVENVQGQLEDLQQRVPE